MTSENGWPVIGSEQLDRTPIPGTGIIPLPGILGGDAGWLLRWVGQQFDQRVMKLYNPGCWGWNAPIAIPGTNVYSNHSSGTAVDLNAPSFPWKTRNMSPEQQAACRDIVAQTEYVVVWGGDFTTHVDQMHFEINGTSEDVSRIVTKLKEDEVIGPDWGEIVTHFVTFTGKPPTAEQQQYYHDRDWGTLNGDLLQWNFDRRQELIGEIGNLRTGDLPDEKKKQIQNIVENISKDIDKLGQVVK